MPGWQFVATHPKGEVCGFAMLGFAAVKLEPLNGPGWIPPFSHVVKQQQIAQGTQWPVFNLDHADIHKECVLPDAGQ